MATQLESLVLEITARNTEIISRLDQADRRLASFEKSAVGRIAKIEATFGGLGRGLQKGMALIGSAAALGGLTQFVKSALETGDAIGDLSTKLGLSSDALQEYQHAAQLSGISSEQFESAVTRLNKSIAEAQDPNSKAGKLFADLGIAVRDAAGNIAGTEPVLTQFLGRLGEIPNAQQRLQVAIAAGGKSMANFAILAAEGAEGIARMRREAHEMGLVLDAETIRQAGTLNDRWDTMTKVLRAQLLPELIKMSPLFIGIAQAAGNAAVSVAKFFNIKPLDLKITEASQEVFRLQQHIDALRDDMERPPDQRSFPNAGVEILKNYEERLEAAKANLSALQKQFGSFTPKPGALPAIDLESLATGGGKTPKASPEEREEQRTLRNTLENIAALRTKNDVLFESIKTHQTLAQAQARILEIESARETGLPGLSKMLSDLTTRENALTEALTEQSRIQQELGEARSLLPKQLDILNRGLATDLPFDRIREQLEALKEDSSLTDVFRKAQFDQSQIDSVLAMSGALRVLQHTAEQAEERTQFISETSRGIREQIAAEETRISILGRAIGQNQRYDDTQKQIADTLERLRLQQEGLELGATSQQIGSLDALLQRYQQLEAQSEALAEAAQRQAQEQQEMHDLVAGGISDLGRELTDMAATGEFSFKRLLAVANRFADRLQDRLWDKAADQIADIFFPAESTPKPIPTVPTVGPAITGPFAVSSLGQQLESLQVPLVSTGTAGIQQLTLAGTTATQQLSLTGTTAMQQLTQVSTSSLTGIQTTSTTGITSIQTVTQAALAAIQAQGQGGGGLSGLTSMIGGQGGAPNFGNVISSSSSTAPSPGGIDFSNVISSSSSTAPSLASSSSGLSSLLSSLMQMSSMMAIIYQLGSLIGGATGSKTGGFIGGLFGGITGLISSLFHEGGTVGRTSVTSRIVSPALFHDAPHFARGGIASLSPDELPAILHRGEIVIPAATSRRLLARDDQMGEVIRAVAARRPVTPALSPLHKRMNIVAPSAPMAVPMPAQSFALGGMAGMSAPWIGETVLSRPHVKEIQQQTDLMPWYGEDREGKGSSRRQKIDIHFHTPNADSFRRNEQQVSHQISRAMRQADRKNS
jgi:hypothetical protein